MSRKASSVNRDQFLARTYDHLRDTKTRLNRQAGSELRAERDADRGDGLDSSDRASEECDRELSSRLSERERIKLGQIDGRKEIWGLRGLRFQNHGNASQGNAFHAPLSRLPAGPRARGQDRASLRRRGTPVQGVRFDTCRGK
jgi:hypothetical protein